MVRRLSSWMVWACVFDSTGLSSSQARLWREREALGSLPSTRTLCAFLWWITRGYIQRLTELTVCFVEHSRRDLPSDPHQGQPGERVSPTYEVAATMADVEAVQATAGEF